MSGMSYDECVGQNILFETVPDIERAKQMLSMAEIRQQFWKGDVGERYAESRSLL